MVTQSFFKSEPRGYGSFFRSENGTWVVVQLLEKRASIEVATVPQFQIGARFPSTELEFNQAKTEALTRLGLQDMTVEHTALIMAYEAQEVARLSA